MPPETARPDDPSGVTDTAACRWCDAPAEVGGLCRPHFADDTRMRREAQRERQRITGFVDGELPAGPGFRHV